MLGGCKQLNMREAHIYIKKHFLKKQTRGGVSELGVLCPLGGKDPTYLRSRGGYKNITATPPSPRTSRYKVASCTTTIVLQYFPLLSFSLSLNLCPSLSLTGIIDSVLFAIPPYSYVSGGLCHNAGSLPPRNLIY